MSYNPEDAKPYEHHREHFIDRLKTRYNIDLNKDEYDELSENQNFDGFIFKLNCNLTLKYVNIKGIKVLCIKRNTTTAKRGYTAKKACLITALVDDKYRWPIPAILKDKVTKINFWKRYYTYVDIIEYLSSNYTEEGRKEFFTTNLFGRYDSKLYNMAYSLRQGTFNICRLVQYLVDEYNV